MRDKQRRTRKVRRHVCKGDYDKKESRKRFYKRILPRDLAAAALALSPLDKEARQRYELEPLKGLAAGETLRPPFDAHSSVIPEPYYIQKAPNDEAEYENK